VGSGTDQLGSYNTPELVTDMEALNKSHPLQVKHCIVLVSAGSSGHSIAILWGCSLAGYLGAEDGTLHSPLAELPGSGKQCRFYPPRDRISPSKLHGNKRNDPVSRAFSPVIGLGLLPELRRRV
jgi:hypothetical protein